MQCNGNVVDIFFLPLSTPKALPQAKALVIRKIESTTQSTASSCFNERKYEKLICFLSFIDRPCCEAKILSKELLL